MKKINLIYIDENKLPDVNLSEDQKRRIKERFQSRLKKFIKDNASLDIDSTTDHISKIEDDLGIKKNSIVHMVEHANVLRELISDAIDKECPLNPEEILYKTSLRYGAGKEFSDSATNWPDDPYYYQLYITKDKILIYALTNNLKLIYTRDLNFSDIKGVAVTKQAYTGYFITKFTNENLVIATTKIVYPYPQEYFFVDDDPKDLTTLKEIETLLLSLGVKKFIPKDKSKTYILVNTVFFLLAIFVIVSCVLYYGL